MPNRIIKESICTSENIDQLTDFQETFFYRLMVNCDDYGRFDARPKILSSRLYPLRNVPVEDVSEALEALQDADLITVYMVEGHAYLQMKTWGKHQQTRANKSKYPSPDAGGIPASENNCNQLISDDSKCPRNRIRNTLYDNRESISSSDTDDDLHQIQAEHNKVIDAAEDAGFKMSNDVRAALINIYAEHGLQKVLDAMKSCVEHGATNLAYLKAVLSGKPKKGGSVKDDIHNYEQRDYSNADAEVTDRLMNMTWGDEKGAG